MEMIEKRDYDAELKLICICEPEWSGSLYYDEGLSQWWVIIPFVQFTAMGRNTDLRKAYDEACLGVDWALKGKWKAYKEQYDVLDTA